MLEIDKGAFAPDLIAELFACDYIPGMSEEAVEPEPRPRLVALTRRGWTVASLALFVALHLARPQLPADSPTLAYLCDVAYAGAVSAFLVSVFVAAVNAWILLVEIRR